MDFPIFVLPGHLTKMSFFRGQIYIWHLFPYWGNSRVLCNIKGVFGANEYPFEGSFAQIVILFSRDIISHDEVALQHVIWYALYLCKLWYKVWWCNKKSLNYCIKVHFGQFTLEFMWFVVPGHYGCLRAFKHKSFFVEGILKSEFMTHVYSIKYMSQMYHLEFGVAFTMFFIAPLTLSRHNKLTVSKTLPSRFTMKSTSLKSTLVICLSICRIVRKKCNLDVSGSKTRSQDQFQKKNPT